MRLNLSCSALAIAMTILPTHMANAYVCSRVVNGHGEEIGPALSWFDRQLTFTLHAEGTAQIAGNAEFDVLRASFAAWEGVQECTSPQRATDISFTELPMTTNDRVGYNYIDPADNENLIIFRDESWPHSAEQEGIIALTITTYVPLTGQLLDSDIEYNSAQFPFDIDGSPLHMDLLNTAVHEVGHFLGLAHTAVAGATMTDRADFGDTDKRTPECDDTNGVAFKYPAQEENGYCDPRFDEVSACGFCFPPGQLTNTVAISVVGRKDGLSGGCTALGGSGAGLLAPVFWLLWRQRRQSWAPIRSIVIIGH